MINIIKQEVEVDIELKKRLEFICEFCNTTPTFINGGIRNIDKTNINYVEPIISKELWEECQVQKKKNSRSFQRTLTYIYMQKVKCPKCKRILGGKATTKKNGNSYFYYYCNDCKISIKESVIENYLCNFIDEIIEYDSVVNQFFLPMIKQKIENPKEELQKQLNEQRIKFDRIKKAYINGTFTLDEYEQERLNEIIEKYNEKSYSSLSNTDENNTEKVEN